LNVDFICITIHHVFLSRHSDIGFMTARGIGAPHTNKTRVRVLCSCAATTERTTVVINPSRSILIVRLRFIQMYGTVAFFLTARTAPNSGHCSYSVQIQRYSIRSKIFVANLFKNAYHSHFSTSLCVLFSLPNTYIFSMHPPE
jgi:hypothetical protein